MLRSQGVPARPHVPPFLRGDLRRRWLRTFAPGYDPGALEPGPLRLWAALNDRIADGRDISWIWDADFELLADRVESVVCSGTRAPELALRLKYAGWPEDRLTVVSDLGRSLEVAMEGDPERIFALPTYTALLELRTLLSEQHGAGRYWQNP